MSQTPEPEADPATPLDGRAPVAMSRFAARVLDKLDFVATCKDVTDLRTEVAGLRGSVDAVLKFIDRRDEREALTENTRETARSELDRLRLEIERICADARWKTLQGLAAGGAVQGAVAAAILAVVAIIWFLITGMTEIPHIPFGGSQ
jgi:hypothetical protein